jgi:hypothetical protein
LGKQDKSHQRWSDLERSINELLNEVDDIGKRFRGVSHLGGVGTFTNLTVTASATFPYLTGPSLLAITAAEVLTTDTTLLTPTFAGLNLTGLTDLAGRFVTATVPGAIHYRTAPETLTDIGANHLTGVVDRAASTLSYAAGVLTIAPTGASFDIRSNGVLYSKAATTFAIPLDNTFYYCYFDTAGVAQVSTSPWEISSDNVPVALVYRVTAALAAVGDERHSAYRDRYLHEALHDTIGARYDFIEGGLTGAFTNTTFSITAGRIHDEDLEHILAAPATTCRLWYRTGGGTTMTFEDSITVPYKMNGATMRYDNAGTLTDVGANQYTVSWVYMTNDTVRPIYVQLGQATYANITNARNAAQPSFGNISTVEWKLLYKLIYRNTGAPPSYIEATDYRQAGGAPATAFVPLVLHHGTHEDGGNDEIDVTGLSGLLADAQASLAHATTHENGGVDALVSSRVMGTSMFSYFI